MGKLSCCRTLISTWPRGKCSASSDPVGRARQRCCVRWHSRTILPPLATNFVHLSNMPLWPPCSSRRDQRSSPSNCTPRRLVRSEVSPLWQWLYLHARAGQCPIGMRSNHCHKGETSERTRRRAYSSMASFLISPTGSTAARGAYLIGGRNWWRAVAKSCGVPTNAATLSCPTHWVRRCRALPPRPRRDQRPAAREFSHSVWSPLQPQGPGGG